MARRNYFLLIISSIFVVLLVSGYQSSPGYMDAEYYFLGGLQLTKGEGFNEPVLWNYLDNPTGLPHPSHVYWMPLPSILAAISMKFAGENSFSGARLGFILLAILIPVLTGKITYQLSGNQRWAIVSGFLTIFSGFYLPFVVTTDTFTIYMVLGGFLFILLPQVISKSKMCAFLVGFIVGLLHLTRADGILWAPMILVFLSFKMKEDLKSKIQQMLLILLGYFLIITPWVFRNLTEFNTLFPPGGMQTLWLTNYDQLFSYPVDILTFQNWWSSGITAITQARLWALGINTQRIIAEQGLIFLTPLIILGMWRLRSDPRVQLCFWAWLLTFLVMTFVFPFAGARGGFFHSNAALQPFFWAIVPMGLNVILEWGEKHRSWNVKQAELIFGTALVGFAFIISAFVFYQRVIGPDPVNTYWEQDSTHYQRIEEELLRLNPKPGDIVMVKNPPGYNIVSNRAAIVIPDGDIRNLLMAAERYNARFVLLESDHTKGLDSLYNFPQGNYPGLEFLQKLDGSLIFEVK